MAREFLGVGWAFPVALVDESTKTVAPLKSFATVGNEDAPLKLIAAAGYEDKILQSITIILSTAPGERVMRPDFGCGIHDLVFSVNNATTAGLVVATVRQALLMWEPRINLLDVQVTTSPDNAAVLMIGIQYTVVATNNAFNLVYPFYLEGSSA